MVVWWPNRPWYVPAAQGLQVRSAVLLPTTKANPAPHVPHRLQERSWWLLLLWKVPVGHCWHVRSLEEVPATK